MMTRAGAAPAANPTPRAKPTTTSIRVKTARQRAALNLTFELHGTISTPLSVDTPLLARSAERRGNDAEAAKPTWKRSDHSGSTGGHGRRPASVPSCIGPGRRPESGAGSHPMNSGTPTPTGCPAREIRLVVRRQLGHADLGITSTYLRGIDNTEIIRAVHELGSTHDSRRPNPPRLSRAPLSHAVMAAPVTDSPRLRHRRPCHRTVPAGTSRILRPSRIAKCLHPGTRAVLTPPPASRRLALARRRSRNGEGSREDHGRGTRDCAWGRPCSRREQRVVCAAAFR